MPRRQREDEGDAGEDRDDASDTRRKQTKNGWVCEGKYSAFSFTINTPTSVEEAVTAPFEFQIMHGFLTRVPRLTANGVLKIEKETDILKHYVWQWERGVEEGRLHIQGCAMLVCRKPLLTIKRLFSLLPDGFNVHIDKINTSYEATVRYCKKPTDGGEWGPGGGRIQEMEEYVEWGELEDGRGTQGKRNDILHLLDTAKSGKNWDDIVMDEGLCDTVARYMPYAREVVSIQTKRNSQQLRDVEVRVYWGTTGTGKTRRVHHESVEKYGDLSQLYVVTADTTFWEGYCGQKDVLYDDMCNEFLAQAGISIPAFLTRLDRYPRIVNIKHRHEWLQCNRIFITSNMPPDQWIPDSHARHLEALMRRLHVIEEMPTTWTPPSGVWLI